ncbi:MarR family winged helix-turn-helix transcriptional regulator [Streptomyces sp. NPDC091217]|uniref:MarR family winged helix-turn-helix transcriptional regulator n=1 Tax=Streptomyces sp. NPDC091217 TaxID=3365975 RepID=UPI00380E45ED
MSRIDDEWVSFGVTAALLSRLLQARAEVALQGVGGPSVIEVELLCRLAESEQGSLRMIDVADLLMVSKSGVTRLVDRLVEAGLVSRYSPPDNRRVVHAQITDKGRAVFEEARVIYAQSMRDTVERHATTEDRRNVHDVLRDVLEANGHPVETRYTNGQRTEADHAPR